MNPHPISRSSRLARPAFQERNVLLVEHNEMLLATRTMLLTDRRYGVFTARDCTEVFAHAHVQEIAVVVISQAFVPLELPRTHQRRSHRYSTPEQSRREPGRHHV